jgi:hypothetical protein
VLLLPLKQRWDSPCKEKGDLLFLGKHRVRFEEGLRWSQPGRLEERLGEVAGCLKNGLFPQIIVKTLILHTVFVPLFIEHLFL